MRTTDNAFEPTEVKNLSSQQNGSGEQLRRDIAKIVLDRRPEEENEVIGLAQEAWRANYGEPRRSFPSQRVNKGKKRQHLATEGTEVAFVRKRRLQVADAAATAASSGQCIDSAAIQRAAAPAWTDKHQSENAFNADKLNKKRLNAYLQGQLTHDEIDEELVRKANAHKAACEKKNKEYLRDHGRRERRSAGGRHLTDDQLRGKAVYIEKSLRDDQGLLRSIRSRGMHIVDGRMNSTIFVVSDPGSPGERILWRLVLAGGYAAVPGVFTEGRGMAVAYSPAVESKRSVWISPGFRERHEASSAIIGDTVKTTPRSRWTIITGPGASFTDAATKAARAGNRMGVLALLHTREKEP